MLDPVKDYAHEFVTTLKDGRSITTILSFESLITVVDATFDSEVTAQPPVLKADMITHSLITTKANARPFRPVTMPTAKLRTTTQVSRATTRKAQTERDRNQNNAIEYDLSMSKLITLILSSQDREIMN